MTWPGLTAPGWMGLYLAAAFGLGWGFGWWAGRRVPDGIEARAWYRMARRLRLRRRRVPG